MVQLLRAHESDPVSAEPAENFHLSDIEALLPHKLEAVIGISGLVTAAAMPFFFGAVHQHVFLSFAAIFYLLSCFLGFFIFRSKNFSIEQLYPTQLSRRIAAGLLILLGYLVLQNFILKFWSNAHPVLTNVSLGADWQDWLLSFHSYLTFFAVFTLALFGFKYVRRAGISSSLLISNLGLIVALVALGHWFYDNGRLFGVFQPEYEYISQRARWPFVNPNHLAAFLLVPFFVALARADRSCRTLFSYLHKAIIRLGMDLLEDQQFQREIVKVLLSTLTVCTIGVAIIGTLSRAALLSIALGTLVYFILRQLHIRYEQNDADSADGNEHGDEKPQALMSSPRRPSRRSRRRSTANVTQSKRIEAARSLEVLSRSSVPLFLLLSLVTLILFFNQRGSEVVEQRLHSSIGSSMADIRLALYAHSLPLLINNPIFGIGIGMWKELFPATMSEQLLGVSTNYLHSDPLQFLIEGGLVGALLVLMLVGWVGFKAFNTLREGVLTPRDFDLISALFAGVIAFLTASAFDFPFRIPAISLCFAAYLALLSLKVPDATD